MAEMIEDHEKRILNRTPDYSLSRGIALLGMISILEKEVSELHPVLYNKSKKIPRIYGVRVLDHWRFQCDNGNPPRFYGWKELSIFYRLRHCFVHNLGTLLPNQTQEIKKFWIDLQAGIIVDRTGEVIKPYFSVDKNDKIILDSLHRLRILTMEFFVLMGVLQPFQLNDGSWVKF